MPRETVSVIIPCFQQGHFLAEALESVLTQSYGAVQPVVVNDGSSDDTAAVAARFGQRIHYLEQANRGLAAARNRGIEEAEGKYLLFLDADDRLHPDAIAWLVDAVAGRDDRVGLMGHRRFTDNAQAAGQVEVVPRGEAAFLPDFIHECGGPPHAFLSPRHLVRQAGGFMPLEAPGCEDWDLWLRLVLRGAELVPVRRVGAYYRRYPGSMSTQGLAMLESRTAVLLRLHGRLLQIPALLDRWGPELFRAEHRVHRRCLVQGARPWYVKELARAMLELTARNVRLPESLPKALLRKVLGSRADGLTLAAMAILFPRRLARYRNGYT